MIIRILIGCLCLGLFGFCLSPKSSKTDEKNGATNAPALHKLLFLQSGKFATGKDATSNARFFVALADNYQYIRSPYTLEQGGDKVAQLIHMINK